MPPNLTTIGENAFDGCSLKQVFITDLANWCQISFGDTPIRNFCKVYVNNELVGEELIIPEGTSFIGDSAFQGWNSIKEVTIPQSVTSIGSYAFYGCNALTCVTIGNSVGSINDSAFGACPNLTSVYCEPTTPPFLYYYTKGISSGTRGSFPFKSDFTIYVPREAYSNYTKYTYSTNNYIAQENWYPYRGYIMAYDFE